VASERDTIRTVQIPSDAIYIIWTYTCQNSSMGTYCIFDDPLTDLSWQASWESWM